jgi:DNA repair exonuclease SbcCD ATPase subunit
MSEIESIKEVETVKDIESLETVEDVDNLEDYQDIDNMNDNIEESNKKIMSMLSSMFMMNNGTADKNGVDDILEYEDGDKDFYSKIDSLIETSNLIYDETCSITISTEQVKDEIADIKNSIDNINNNIDFLKDRLQELINLAIIQVNK